MALNACKKYEVNLNWDPSHRLLTAFEFMTKKILERFKTLFL